MEAIRTKLYSRSQCGTQRLFRRDTRPHKPTINTRAIKLKVAFKVKFTWQASSLLKLRLNGRGANQSRANLALPSANELHWVTRWFRWRLWWLRTRATSHWCTLCQSPGHPSQWLKNEKCCIAVALSRSTANTNNNVRTTKLRWPRPVESKLELTNCVRSHDLASEIYHRDASNYNYATESNVVACSYLSIWSCLVLLPLRFN